MKRNFRMNKFRTGFGVPIILSLMCVSNLLALNGNSTIRKAQRLIVHNAKMITGFAHLTVNYEGVEFDRVTHYQGNWFGLGYTFYYSEPNDPRDTGYATLHFIFDANGKLNNIRIGNYSSWVQPFGAATLSMGLVLAIVIESEDDPEKRAQMRRDVAKMPDAKAFLEYVLQAKQG